MAADAWRVVRVGDVAQVFDGPHATPKATASGPVFLGISSLSSGRLDLTRSGFLSEEDFEKWTRRIKPVAGDVVFSYETRLGEAALIPPGLRCCLGRRMGLLRPNPSFVDSRFLLYAYLGPTFQETLRQRTVRGSTVDRLPIVDFPNFPLELPPLEVQRAIADTLGSLDGKIEANRRCAETAEALLDVLADASRLPSAPLAELVDVDRIACEPVAQGRQLVDHFSIPVFDDRRLPDRTPAETIKSQKFLIQHECVLVSRLNPKTNRTWFAVPTGGVMAMASTEFLVLRPRAGLSIGALWLAVRSDGFRSELARRATGTSGSHQRVRPDDALSIDVPDVRRHVGAAAEADGLLRIAHHARVESVTLAELRDTLLPELLSRRLTLEAAQELVEPGSR